MSKAPSGTFDISRALNGRTTRTLLGVRGNEESGPPLVATARASGRHEGRGSHVLQASPAVRAYASFASAGVFVAFDAFGRKGIEMALPGQWPMHSVQRVHSDQEEPSSG